jgi:hypothetical protein
MEEGPGQPDSKGKDVSVLIPVQRTNNEVERRKSQERNREAREGS